MYQSVLLLALAGGPVGNPPPAGCQAAVVVQEHQHVGLFDRLRAHFPQRGVGCHGGLFSGGLFHRSHRTVISNCSSGVAIAPAAGAPASGAPAPATNPSPPPPAKLPAATPTPVTPPPPAPAAPPQQKKVGADAIIPPVVERPAAINRLQVSAPNQE